MPSLALFDRKKKKKKKAKTFHNNGNVYPYSPQTVCGNFNKSNGIDDNEGLRGPASSSPYLVRVVGRVRVRLEQNLPYPSLPHYPHLMVLVHALHNKLMHT